MSSTSTIYITPVRRVLLVQDVSKWLKSKAFDDFTKFLLALAHAVEKKPLHSETVAMSSGIGQLLDILDVIDTWVLEIEPLEQEQRFGNKAYRQWHERLVQHAAQLVEQLFSAADDGNESSNSSKIGAVVELLPYFLDSFGNATRIDYGTGHEANFIMFLCCLFKLEILVDSDAEATVSKVFYRYLKLTRHLQQRYRMEPAGSKGAHSLDDFQFLPFYFGSAQLLDANLNVDSFLNEELVAGMAEENLFMNAVHHINQMKTGPFYEHSNQLYNISGVVSWRKIHEGLMKMYKAEVLSKYPVVQHFVFGSLLSFDAV